MCLLIGNWLQEDNKRCLLKPQKATDRWRVQEIRRNLCNWEQNSKNHESPILKIKIKIEQKFSKKNTKP